MLSLSLSLSLCVFDCIRAVRTTDEESDGQLATMWLGRTVGCYIRAWNQRHSGAEMKIKMAKMADFIQQYTKA